MSYSHQDEAWAAWVHNALETSRVPRSLVGRTSTDGWVPRRVFPIFRDPDKLPGAADLGAKIYEALPQSRYLIVICSPRAGASAWVNEEVKQFKALGREDRVLCLIVDGEPNASDQSNHRLQECFPPVVRFRANERGELTATRTEPLAADARKGEDGKVNAKLKLLAGLLGVGYNELRQRVRQGSGATSVVLADAGLPVPEGLRTFLDRHEVSVLRPVRSDMEVRQAAARLNSSGIPGPSIVPSAGSIALSHMPHPTSRWSASGGR
jgi:hypothetical protein